MERNIIVIDFCSLAKGEQKSAIILLRLDLCDHVHIVDVSNFSHLIQ
jgi:hypothetical protein